MTTLSEKIKAARLARNWTQQDLARRAQVTQGTIGHLETGRSMATTKLPQIAKALGMDVESLLAGISDYQPSFASFGRLPKGQDEVLVWEGNHDQASASGRVWIDRYDYDFVDGSLIWNLREQNTLPLDRQFFETIGSQPEDCRLLTVRGDSMEPFLFDNDMFMVDVSKTQPREAMIYAMVFEGEPLIKQVFKESGGALRLHSYNPAYPDKLVQPEHLERLTFIGQYIYRSGAGMRL